MKDFFNKLRNITIDTLYTLIATIILCGLCYFIISLIFGALFVIPFILVILFFIWIFDFFKTHS